MVRTVSSPLFVGRREELDRVSAALAGAAEGTGTFLLIAGEAGVGKSRFVEEASRTAGAAGSIVAIGRSVGLGASAVPYAPVREALRELMKTADIAGIDGTASATADPFLGRPAPAAPNGERIGVGPDTSQARAFEACLELLRGVSLRRPVFLVIEDIHWADRSTLDLLAYLANGLTESATVLAATFRSDELHRGHPLVAFLGEVQRARTTERIDLARFSREEVARQVGGIVGRPATDELIGRVFQRSDGNAFYAEEVLAAEASGTELAPGMRDVLLARVATLSDPARELLRLISAGGLRISTSIVARVAGLEPGDLDALLREAADRHLLTLLDVDGEEFVAFRHALVQEAVYAELLPGERSRLHARYGEAIESVPRPRHVVSPELAYHWYAAHDLPRALSASIGAGQDAAAAHAFGDAHAHFERALQIWDQVPDAGERAAIDRVGLLELAASAASESDPSRAAALMLDAIRSLGSETDATRRALLNARLGRYAWLAGDGRTALELSREAARLLPEAAPPEARARVLAGLCQTLMVTIHVEDARPICESAVAAARAAEAPEIEAHAMDTLGQTSVYLGDLDEGRTLLRGALELGLRIGSADEASRAHANLVDVLSHSGLLAAAGEHAVEAYRYAEENGLARLIGVISLTEGGLAFYRLGHWDRAEDLLQLAWRQSTSGVPRIQVEERLALLDVGRGRFDVAETRIAVARPLIERAVEAQLIAPLAEAAAELALWRGDQLGARAEVAAAFDRLPAVPAYISRLGPLFALGVRVEADLSELARARRDDDALTRSRTIALGYLGTVRDLRRVAAERLPNFLSQAEAWLALSEAELTRLEGHDDAAAWARGAAALEAIPMSYPLAYASFRGAAATLASSHDRAAATRQIHEARDIAVELGAAPLLGEIDGLAHRARIDLLPAVDVVAPGQPGDELGLTPREREILVLLADGRSNREIAQALFITEGTAGSHVSNILGKLGVRSRTEAAGVAHRLGLVAGLG